MRGSKTEMTQFPCAWSLLSIVHVLHLDVCMLFSPFPLSSQCWGSCQLGDTTDHTPSPLYSFSFVCGYQPAIASTFAASSRDITLPPSTPITLTHFVLMFPNLPSCYVCEVQHVQMLPLVRVCSIDHN
jgi:hypothetical protein